MQQLMQRHQRMGLLRLRQVHRHLSVPGSAARYSPRRHVLATNSGSERRCSRDDTLFSCLTCSLCDTRCPAEVSYTELVQRAARGGVHAKDRARVPARRRPAVGDADDGQGRDPQDRLGWLDRRSEDRTRGGRGLLLDRLHDVLRCVLPRVRDEDAGRHQGGGPLLNKLGVTPVVSPEERCCGHDLLWNGDRRASKRWREHNVELVQASGARSW